MKILLAVDGSPNGTLAVKTLIRQIPWFSDKPKLDLIYVHPPLRPIGSLLGTPLSQETLDKYYQDEAHHHLAESKRLLQDAIVPFETHVFIGEPALDICKFANSHKSDLIYIGSRGMGAIGNLVLGSTATKILHIAKIPVVIVPAETPE